MKQYLNLLEEILHKGTWKEPSRPNLPKTLSLFGTRMEFDMADGFPLLTTKKVHFKSILVELLWFLKGDTNITYLVNHGCNIWNQDAYRWYLKISNETIGKDEFTYSFDEFIYHVKNQDGKAIAGSNYKFGDLGKVYGHQWRNQNGIDQIKVIINRLVKDPTGRYAILDAWNPSDFNEMALPPCHLLYQFNCRQINIHSPHYLEQYGINGPKYYLDLQLYQRSCDTLLGVPFNIASASLLLHIIAKIVGMIPGKFIWIGGDTHIYENHLEQVNEQLSRTPTELPQLKFSENINWNYTINHSVHHIDELLKYLTIDDFKIENYNPQEKIIGKLNAGLKDDE
jgi:thymidylate synthase